MVSFTITEKGYALRNAEGSYFPFVKADIDNGPEKLLPWPPCRTELPEGVHEIAITVYGSRRNAMGPFYAATAWPEWTGPAQFKMLAVKTRQLVPCGLLSAPILRRTESRQNGSASSFR